MRLYLFGVPGKVGGAATKIRHLILLLKSKFDITVVLPSQDCLANAEVVDFLKRAQVRYCARKKLELTKGGIALGICELDFFTSGLPKVLKEGGVRVVWSNEMMWEFKGEAEAVKAGLIDKVLFVSDLQAAGFDQLYRGIPYAIPGNYVAPEDFEFGERRNEVFTIGRLSRPDPDKYPEDFPVFYQELGLKEVRYRVMAWDDRLRRKYAWHRFGPEWDLKGPGKERTDKFLQSLDLFVYPLGHRFTESWGRSTVEAMLTGAIPLVPAGHQFHNVIVNGETGFICKKFEDYREVAHMLYDSCALRQRISRQCADHARNRICSPEEHQRIWISALTT